MKTYKTKMNGSLVFVEIDGAKMKMSDPSDLCKDCGWDEFSSYVDGDRATLTCLTCGTNYNLEEA